MQKLLTIITESLIKNEIVHELRNIGISSYTDYEVAGAGDHGQRDDDWFMDTNIKFEVVCDQEIAIKLSQTLSKKYKKNYGMFIYTTPAEIL